MNLQIFTKIASIFKPIPTVPLGRWRLKHDPILCDKYLKNYYGDPGYPNILRNKWINTLEKNEGIIETSQSKSNV